MPKMAPAKPVKPVPPRKGGGKANMPFPMPFPPKKKK